MSVASSPSQSASTPPGRPPRAAGRVAAAAAALESKPADDPSRSPREGDIDRLREAGRVNAVRESYVQQLTPPTSIPHPQLSPRAASPLTPPPPPRRPSAPPVESPASLLATTLANLSIRDSEDEGSPLRARRSNGPVLPATADTAANGAEDMPEARGLALGLHMGEKKASPVQEKGQDVGTTPTRSNGSATSPPVASGPMPLKHVESKDELALLVVSSSITELSMSIQDVNTLIFEIQELRHTSSAISSSAPPLQPSQPNDPSFSSAMAITSSSESSLSSEAPSSSTSAPASNGQGPVSEMDAALMKLEGKLEDVRKEFAEIQSQIRPLLCNAMPPSPDSSATSEPIFLRQKWEETVVEWEETQKDADILGEELKEDKWLVVFKSVSQQAEEMMRSLEKVLTQSQQFVEDVHRRKGKSIASSGSGFPSSRPPPARTPSGLPVSSSEGSISSLSAPSSYFGDAANIQPLLSSFVALHRSLHAKVKYYSPACDRVLKILGKGISDRSTKNGEVLRRFGEMKSRWRTLLNRIERTEAEMKSVEEMLREAAEPVELKEKEKEKSRLSEFGSTLTPPREMSPGRLSPLRRLANKVSTRSMSLSTSPSGTPTRSDQRMQSRTAPSPSHLRSPTSVGMYPSPSGSSTSTSTSAGNGTPRPTPPRPPKSLKRLVSDSKHSSPSPTPPCTPQTLSHRRSASALAVGGASSTGASALGTSQRYTRRAPSPLPPPTSIDNRPRWNSSVRRNSQERETLSQSAMGAGRPPLRGAFNSSRAGTPTAARSGRHSSLGLRSSSRMSFTSSVSRSYDARPVSPAFSDASSAVHRERPSTPSRIPRPSSVMRQRSATPFSSLEDPDTTSLLQRAMSPTPDYPLQPNQSRLALRQSAGPSSTTTSMLRRSSSRSEIPIPTPGTLSPPRAASPSPSAGSGYYRGQTPEPNLVAHAQRLAYVRAPHSRPPPVPRLPSSYRDGRGGGGTTLRASRPPSSLGTRSGAFSPLPTGDGPTSYVPTAHDPLDVAVAGIVKDLPILLHVERVDPPLSRAQAAQLELFTARYLFSLNPLEDQRRAIMCKLVERVGPRARKGDKKVLCRIGGGWLDLESHCLSMLAL
ncbi:hypothetical protein JCM1841_003013 [Sporobolomyces salmonicolor]